MGESTWIPGVSPDGRAGGDRRVAKIPAPGVR
jgi:hypothetical protein